MSAGGEAARPEAAGLRCGAAGATHGPVVGCCHVCGLLLCEEHLYHLPNSWRFGRVSGKRARPLVCGNHRTPGAIKGFFKRREGGRRSTGRLQGVPRSVMRGRRRRRQ